MSWVAHLLNPAQTSQTGFAPSSDRQPPVFSNVQNCEDGSNGIYHGRRVGEYAQSMEVAEEEDDDYRHPYWQVSQRQFALNSPGLPNSHMS